VRQSCALDETGLNLMRLAMHQLQLSMCANHRVLKLARPIAHLAEALQYRPRISEMG